MILELGGVVRRAAAHLQSRPLYPSSSCSIAISSARSRTSRRRRRHRSGVGFAVYQVVTPRRRRRLRGRSDFANRRPGHRLVEYGHRGGALFAAHHGRGGAPCLGCSLEGGIRAPSVKCSVLKLLRLNRAWCAVRASATVDFLQDVLLDGARRTPCGRCAPRASGRCGARGPAPARPSQGSSPSRRRRRCRRRSG